MNIKEQFKETEKLYHFTSFDTALKIIESNRLRFGRLSNMNDIHEVAKNMFVDTNGRPIDKFPSDVLNVVVKARSSPIPAVPAAALASYGEKRP